MTDLEACIRNIEDGIWPGVFLSDACHWDAYAAYNGSIDAAKRLHDALLPGWMWSINSRVDDQFACSVHVLDSSARVFAAPNPARAWLLSILRAVKAKG